MSTHLVEVARRIEDADALVIGASNGLSIAEGIHLFGENEKFRQSFGDFHERFGFRSIIRGCFFPFAEPAIAWAFNSRMHSHFMQQVMPSPVVADLIEVVGSKPYFVITSNIDGRLGLSGINASRIFEVEGSCRNLQCAKPCHDQLYPAEDLLSRMAKAQRDMTVPVELIPHCPRCTGPMQLHIETDERFLRGRAWKAQKTAFAEHVQEYRNGNLVFLELGIGPHNQLIKAPMMQLAKSAPSATYVAFNVGAANNFPCVIDPSRYFYVDGNLRMSLARVREALR